MILLKEFSIAHKKFLEEIPYPYHSYAIIILLYQ
jgi:hypothetical protein